MTATISLFAGPQHRGGKPTAQSTPAPTLAPTTANRYVHALFETSADALVTTDAAGTITAANRTAETLTGWTHEMLAGSRLVTHLADPLAIEESVARAMREGTVRGVPLVLRHRAGYFVDALATVTVVYDDGGQLDAVLVSIRDVTDRSRDMAGLTKRELALHQARELALVGAWDYDVSTQVLSWAADVYRIYEVPPDFDASNAQECLAFFAGSDRDHVDRAFARAVEHGEPFDLEARLTTGRGRTIWIRMIGRIEWKNGNVARVFGYIADIDERKRAELAAAATTELLAAAIDAAPVAIHATDLRRRVTLWNPAAERLYGYSKDEILGHDVDDIMPRDARRMYHMHREAALSGNPPREAETYRTRKDGTVFPVAVSYAPMHDAAGATVGVVGVVEDVTARKQIEDALRRVNADLERQLVGQTAALDAAQRALRSRR